MCVFANIVSQTVVCIFILSIVCVVEQKLFDFGDL